MVYNEHIKVIDLLSLATGWDTAYMTENPEKVIEVLKEIKVEAQALRINSGWCSIEDIKEYITDKTLSTEQG